MYIEKAAETMFVQKISTFNVDEIDTLKRLSEDAFLNEKNPERKTISSTLSIISQSLIQKSLTHKKPPHSA